VLETTTSWSIEIISNSLPNNPLPSFPGPCVRMRNATVVVVNLKGLGTETIKNIVLAGIGKLIVVDEGNVAEEDLGAGFFFTEEDVGKNVGAFMLHR
jgi:molybdopterin/thiamine biosynthesis adenylyltransferase